MVGSKEVQRRSGEQRSNTSRLASRTMTLNERNKQSRSHRRIVTHSTRVMKLVTAE